MRGILVLATTIPVLAITYASLASVFATPDVLKKYADKRKVSYN